MGIFRGLLLACVIPVVLAETAHAATIFTPPVIPDDDGSFFAW